MAFTANDRVIVSDQNSQFRNRMGTVEIPVADSAYELNHVRLDGFPAGKTEKFADIALRTTSFPDTIDYSHTTT